MFLYTREELTGFFSAQLLALFVCLLYDLLKGLKPEKISRCAADIFDAAVWLPICITTLVLWQSFFYGEFRWYTVLAFCLAALLYFLTIHKPIFSAYCIIVKKIYGFFHTIFKILLTVWHFLGKISICLSVVLKRLYSVDYKDNCYEKD